VAGTAAPYQELLGLASRILHPFTGLDLSITTMRIVPIKSDEQLDLQSLHRAREWWVMRRTAVINQIRGLLLERGITLRKGRRYIEEALPGILEDADAKLPGAVRFLWRD
jgi:transposase